MAYNAQTCYPDDNAILLFALEDREVDLQVMSDMGLLLNVGVPTSPTPA